MLERPRRATNGTADAPGLRAGDLAEAIRETKPSPYRNLVFEGGGVKGIAYVGAIEELEARGITPGIRRVGGASAGAIQALAFSLGYTSAELKRLMWETDFKSFLDTSKLWIPEFYRLASKFGWYPGDRIHAWLRNMIAESTGSGTTTFRELHDWSKPDRQADGRKRPDLYVVATNLSARDFEIFSYETRPDFEVALAVRMSLSIPVFFAAVRSQDNVFVDGGVLNNYPVKLFDKRRYVEGKAHRTEYYDKAARKSDLASTNAPDYPVFNRETLGFNLHARDTDSVRESTRIKGWGDYATAFVASVWEAKDRRHIHEDDWKRTIYIDTKGVKFTDFSLTRAQKDDLVREGREGVRRYFEWLEKEGGADAAWSETLLALS